MFRSLSIGVRVLCGVHFLFAHGAEIAQTAGESMLPTLNNYGDAVFARKIPPNKINSKSYLNCKLKVGDTVVALKPTDPLQRVCKRIVGMPGDIIIRENSFNHFNNLGGDGSEYLVVPEGHCWLEGDNLSQSMDSRSYGPVPLGLVKAKIEYIWTIRDGIFGWRKMHNSLEDVNLNTE